MILADFIRAMPKVELHVHLEGAIHPADVLELARRNQITLPSDTVEGLQQWYTFTDFANFVRVYIKISECIRTPDDLEWVARQFLMRQAAQNIRHTEFTYTPFTHFMQKGLSAADQMNALNRARAWAYQTYGVSSGIILDISRNVTPEQGLWTAQMAVDWMYDGVVALGLGGPELGHLPGKHAESFKLARDAGQACILHAGELDGATSIWGALEQGTVRIGHGVRCLEDPALVAELRARQIPLEVSPTSNVCLKVAPSIAAHPLPRLLAEGLYITLNSDDPPMFNTTLTDEWLLCAEAFGWNTEMIEYLTLNAVNAARLPDADRAQLAAEFRIKFSHLREA